MRIHIVSSPVNLNSGFSIVARNIALGLQKLGYEVNMSGISQAYDPGIYYGIESLPIIGTNFDEIGQLIVNIRNSNPDIVLNIFQSDTGVFREHAMAFDSVNILNLNSLNIEKNIPEKIKCFWYTPIESLGLSYSSIRDLKSFIQVRGKVVAQCRWGENEMKKEGIDSVCIYHGVDNNIFKPLDNKDINRLCNSGNIASENIVNKKKILIFVDNRWTEVSIDTDKLGDINKDIHKSRFVFLVVAANIGVRKRMERAMRAYSIMIGHSKQLRDTTVLHLHTQPFNPEGARLLDISQRLSIENNIVFSYGKWKSGWSDVDMSILYNSSDCHLSASSGEGFGLSTIHSQACGIPTVGPRNTSFIELVEEEVNGEDGKRIGPRGILCEGDYQLIIDGSYRFLVNEYDLALKMKMIYIDSKLREQYSKNALEFAKLYTWKNIVKDWDKLLRTM